jgi:hypothetical protein
MSNGIEGTDNNFAQNMNMNQKVFVTQRPYFFEQRLSQRPAGDRERVEMVDDISLD